MKPDIFYRKTMSMRVSNNGFCMKSRNAESSFSRWDLCENSERFFDKFFVSKMIKLLTEKKGLIENCKSRTTQITKVYRLFRKDIQFVHAHISSWNINLFTKALRIFERIKCQVFLVSTYLSTLLPPKLELTTKKFLVIYEYKLRSFVANVLFKNTKLQSLCHIEMSNHWIKICGLDAVSYSMRGFWFDLK